MKRDILTGERVRLRGFEASDVENKVRWVNDPETRATLNYAYPLSRLGTLEWARKLVGRDDHIEMVIEDLSDGRAIGFAGLKDIDWRSRKAEMYMTIGEADYRGKGYGTEVRRIHLRYAFEELGLHRIYLYNWINNGAARRVNEKMGFKLEGILRADVFSHGEYRDRVVMGILRDEYRCQRQGSGGSQRDG